jgi:hypothetical protein
MNRSEIAKILALAAARDLRTVGDVDVLAWHEDIGDLDFADAREAVTRHYRESTDRLMPAHVRRLVKLVREERRRLELHEVRALPCRFEDDITRDIRVREGVAQCRDVIAAVMERLAAKRDQQQAS